MSHPPPSMVSLGLEVAVSRLLTTSGLCPLPVGISSFFEGREAPGGSQKPSSRGGAKPRPPAVTGAPTLGSGVSPPAKVCAHPPTEGHPRTQAGQEW